MEGKTVILSVLIMSLVVAQIQVEAKSCCPSTSARNVYNGCRRLGRPREFCARLSGCKLVRGPRCPRGWEHDILEKSDAVQEYCELGCASSVCGALTTLQNSDESGIVNEEVAQCTKACSDLCSNGPVIAGGTA